MSTRQRLVVLGLIGLAVASASAQDRKGGRRRPRPVPQNGDAVLRIELKEGSDGQIGAAGGGCGCN